MRSKRPATSNNQKITKEPSAVGLPVAGPPSPSRPPPVVRDYSDSTTSSISDEGEEDQRIEVSTKIRFKKKMIGSTNSGGGNDNEKISQKKEHQTQNGSANKDGKRRISISNSTPPSSPGRLSPLSRRSERRRRRTSIDLSEYFEHRLSSPSYDPDDDEEDNIHIHSHSHNRMGRSFRYDKNQKIYQRIVVFLTSISISEVVEKITHIHYFWTSPVLLRMYAAVFVAVTIRQYWVLQTISLMIVMRMVALLTQWGLFVWRAPNFRRVKSMVLWWANFGLGLATKSVSDGPSIHRFVASVSVTVAKGIGKDVTIGAIKGITDKNRQKVLTVAKDNMKLVNGRAHKE